jgi:elongation factor G
VFQNLTTNTIIPQGFVPSIEKGITDAMELGILAGFPMTDIKVTVVDGKYHEVDSGKRDFEIAASIAFQEACSRAAPILIEPIMHVDTRVIGEYVGAIVNDFAGRRATVEGVETEGKDVYLVKAFVPIRDMFGYVTDLRSLTSGRGTFTMQFEHYEPVELAVAQEIIRIRKASGQAQRRR